METYIGIGFRVDVSSAEIENSISALLKELAVEIKNVKGLYTVDFKVNEELQKASKNLGIPLFCFSRNEINDVSEMAPSKSAASDVFGICGVAEPCAILATGKTKNDFELVSKKVFDKKITLAVTRCYQ